tara:strand:- start:1267 stop:1971 length:705 start_codon:yes stop_codon:yes gene_type:complete
MKTITTLTVSERFLSIQGEGVTTGIPAVFLRLAGCNLLCKSESWICDSIEVWQKGTKTPFAEVLTNEMIAALHDGAHLVITGGEPMLHQPAIIAYLNWLDAAHGFIPTIEVETNGTIMPSRELFNFVDYWNCSPKLSTSGESRIRRLNESVLAAINSQPNAMFKFVITSTTDAEEVVRDFGDVVDKSNIVFMPAGCSQEELLKTRMNAVQLSIEYGVRYSDRLHIVIWNLKTGV